MTVTILELYPSQLNLNGDTGNRRALAHRLRLAGIDVDEQVYKPGDELLKKPEIVLLGTGTSSALRSISSDLERIAPVLRSWADDGVVFFAAGAGYHLLGKELVFGPNDVLHGVGIFDLTVDLSGPRVITEGFALTISNLPVTDLLLGTENHTARVQGGTEHVTLGTVRRGVGNGNGVDGSVKNNAIGTHTHGPALVVNPQLADYLLSQAARRAGLEYLPGSQHAELDAIVAHVRALFLKKVPTDG